MILFIYTAVLNSKKKCSAFTSSIKSLNKNVPIVFQCKAATSRSFSKSAFLWLFELINSSASFQSHAERWEKNQVIAGCFLHKR